MRRCVRRVRVPLPARLAALSTTACGGAANKKLYPGHYPMTVFQRAFLAGTSAFTAIADPTRADMVAVLGETTGTEALRRLHRTMVLDAGGRELLTARPVLTKESAGFDRLRSLPAGTLGRAYADFMAHHGFSPDGRCAVRFVDDSDLAYVLTRYRQVHDFWHVLAGLPPTVEAELALKVVEMVQTGLPVTALAALCGPAALSAIQRRHFTRIYVPWALRVGRRAAPLINIWYERQWDVPLEELRRTLRFEPAPPG
ncbi:unnamed protein product [Phaeothamnion confervicola]